MFQGHEEVDELEARLARVIVDGGQLGEQGVAQIRPIAKRARHRRQIVARHVDGRLQVDGGRGLESRTGNLLLQRGDERGGIRRVRHVHQVSFCCAIFRWSCTMP